MEHPVVRFYIMRYNQGKTKIPKQWEPMVMEALKKLEEDANEETKKETEQKEK